MRTGGVEAVARKFLVFGISCLIVGIIVFSFLKRREPRDDFVRIYGTEFKIGKINVDTERREITFNAEVRKNNGQVLYLLYLFGYTWLEKESAIISDARLTDLQKAIASIDWKLWDDIWVNRKNYGVDIYIKYNGKKINVRECVTGGGNLNVHDFVFVGSPYFDSVALERTFTEQALLSCDKCPLLPFERALILDTKSETPYYFLIPEKLPQVGEKVEVIFKL